MGEILCVTRLPKLILDTERIQQVFINLMTNAVQAMPNGGELHIRARLQQGENSNGSCLTIEFQDTGVGINEEDQKRLFEPLFTTKSKGTGLGLAISAGIVNAHGGKIEFSSLIRQGSTFIVSLPVKVENEAGQL